MNRRIAIATLAVSSILATPAVAQKYRASITRTEQGIPHIVAKTMGGLGYGSGYAAAQDNGCVIGETLVTVRGERSRWFGKDGTASIGFSDIPNLESDFYHRAIADLPRLRAAQAATSPDNRAMIEGFRIGYNRYLRDHPEGFAASCRGAAWLRPIDADDALLLVNSAMTLISSAQLARQIAGATPPSPTPASASAAALDLGLPDGAAKYGMGSNGWAFGGDVTSNGRGLLVGNPHFPWAGPNRFRRLHLTIPGKFDAMGGGLIFMPTIGIGFNRHIAWTHTVTTASHFTLFQLKLDPANPLAYLIDGKSEPMTSQTVTVVVKDGEPVTRTLYSTRYGPVVAMPNFGMAWTRATAYSMRDANQANLRSGDAWIGIARARNVGEIRDVIGKTLGIPWVNTIAADSAGNALYADVTAVPNMSAERIDACLTPAGKTPMARNAGVFILDGARGDCNWAVDASTPVPGLLPFKDQAVLIRRDYVQNSNDSYWLSNFSVPYRQLSPILGPWGTVQNLRTRSAHRELPRAIAGGKLDPATAKTMSLANIVHAAELVRPALLDLCKARPTLAEACAVLAAWDGKAENDSRGALLFFAFWRRTGSIKDLWVNPFDPARPGDSPSQLNSRAADAILDALAAAAAELAERKIALDAPLGSVQVALRGQDRIPVHGGPGSAGVLNAMNGVVTPDGVIPAHGSSYMQVVSFGPKGPVAESMLAYSQSTNPDSPNYADGTQAFSAKNWLKLPFTPAEVAAAKQGETITISE